jgi:hypothetical protein
MPTANDDRTTDLGLFNTAYSYWAAAALLAKSDLKISHRSAPIYFFYFHAIELFLKSFLRLNGVTLAELASRKLGHNMKKVGDEARRLGFPFMDEDEQVLLYMHETDIVIQSRYIVTGPFKAPTFGALSRTCKSFYETVGNRLIEQGAPIHWVKNPPR